MEYIKTIIDFLLHFDRHLSFIVSNFGVWTYLLLFLIIFAETGLVITPFLPGDSLIFIVGAFSAVGSFNVFLVFALLSAAAIAGDSLNYAIGKRVGPKVFKYENARFLKKDYLIRTQRFYDKYGPVTIILARFVPIVRTFAPFVAGIGKMNYAKFIAYNCIGGIGWVAIFLFAGFCLGNIPFVKDNFTFVVYIIIFLSILPIVLKFAKHKLAKQKVIAKTE